MPASPSPSARNYAKCSTVAEATKAAARKRLVQMLVVGALVLGGAIGFVLGLLVRLGS
jgi:hypothetical protein